MPAATDVSLGDRRRGGQAGGAAAPAGGRATGSNPLPGRMVDPEAEHPGHVLALGIQRVGDEVVERHEEQVGERRAEGRPVDGPGARRGARAVVGGAGADRRGMVHRLAAGAVDLDGVGPHLIAQTDGEDGLAVALDEGAGPELLCGVLRDSRDGRVGRGERVQKRGEFYRRCSL
jgi:hypothetical protein